MVVDINDFPSFRQVPDAVDRVARAVLRLAGSAGDRAPMDPERTLVG
jgi:ribosomal protein S6--L-glutamate ligase